MWGGSAAAELAHHTAFGTGVNGKMHEGFSGCVGPFGNRSRHEAQKENQQSDARPHQAFAVERPPGIEKRRMTEAQGKQKHAPEKPPLPPVNNVERHHAQRERDGYLAMPVAHDRIKNVAAIELAGGKEVEGRGEQAGPGGDRKSTRLNSSHGYISYAVFCLKKKKKTNTIHQSSQSGCW